MNPNPGKGKGKGKTKEMLLREMEESPVIQVTAYQDGKAIGSWDFHGEQITIGRSRSADLRLPSETISRLHAVLERTPENILRIKDAGSRNGLYLNDQKVEASVLTRSDTIRIGNFTLQCALRLQGEISALHVQERTVKSKSDPQPARTPSTVPKPEPKIVPEEDDRPSKPTRPTRDAKPPQVQPKPELAELAVPKPSPSAAHGQSRVAMGVKKSRTPHDEMRQTVAAPIPMDDAEDADLDVEPGFSLVDAIRAAKLPRITPSEGVLEIVAYRGEKILQVTQVTPGGAYRLSRDTLASFDADGVITVNLPAGCVGTLWDEQGSDPLEGADGYNSVRLLSGEVIELLVGGRGTRDEGLSYLLRLVPAPSDGDAVAAGAAAAVAGAPYGLAMGGISVGGHLLIMFILLPLFVFLMSLFSGFATEAPKEVEFAEVKLELPEEEKKPEKKKEKKKKKTPPKTKLAKVTRTQAAPQTRQQKVASAGILGAMGKMDVKFNSRAPLLAAATNLKGVKVPGGGGYKVSGIAVKGKGVMNGRPGGAFGSQDMGTLNGQIFGAKGGHGGIKKRGGGKVRGTVAVPPARKVGVKGHLDRSQIARVVNKHIHEVRHCYEKNLLRDPSLAGKILVEWTIAPNGRVVQVKTKYSSLRGGAVPGCIASRIRTWQFPKPKGGGHVVVNYPFMFESVGF